MNLTGNDFLSHNLSPVPSQMFVWFVNREDATTCYEFTNEGVNNNYNKEVDERKEEIKEFGLIGNGSKIYFNTKDGIINIADRKIKLFVESDEDINVYLRLTENDEADYHNVVQYKKAAFISQFQVLLKLFLVQLLITLLDITVKQNISLSK